MRLVAYAVEVALACLALLVMFDAGRANSARTELAASSATCGQMLDQALTQSQEAGELMLSMDERLLLAIVVGRRGRALENSVSPEAEAGS